MILFPFYLSLILRVHITNGQSLDRYSPADDITIDCGSSEKNTSTDSPRNWVGDINSKFFPLNGENNASIASPAIVANQMLTESVDPVPYGTARLSLSEFTYVIPVHTAGPKFIRLYFYSAIYKNFDSSKAIFSVKTDEYTLLTDFSVDLAAEALGRKSMMKEFCVTVSKSSDLNIKFSPSSSIPRAIAFVNGIEIVSMPAELYNWDPEGRPGGISFVGQNSFYMFSNNTALEMMYRVNIGGRPISPDDDTGFFRSWQGAYRSGDEYLAIPRTSVVVSSLSSNLSFSRIPYYIAPVDVYQTARTMGPDRDVNIKYKLTWEFPVDSGFFYMVRLHFCEITVEINSTGDRTFVIFITNQTAEGQADVIGWTGGKYIPYFKDYIVAMLRVGGGAKKVNLSVALQANPSGWMSVYPDAILNGVEIFKLNNSNGNLADPIQHVPSPKQRKQIITIVSAIVCSVVFLFVLGFLTILLRRRGFKNTSSSDGTTWCGPIPFGTTRSSKTPGSSSLPSDPCRYFSLAEIKAATKNFNDNYIIGVGGFGNVYKGHIDGGATTVAIKRLKPESSQGIQEFKTEIEMLSHLRHLNLVSLIGYCDEKNEMILVYEYMARGTLSDHLYNTENPPLSWRLRLQICTGAANGLHYLHAGINQTIIHRDVKTTNILLDEKWVAKVSDFGLSKVRPSNTSKTYVSTMVKGSIGYLDPEYYRLLRLTEKSDVYSFGVVLCEILCGRPPVMPTVESMKMSLAEWARSCYHDGTLDQIVDPYLIGKIAPECLKKFGEIAVSCILDNGVERPSMKEVLWGLETAMQLQQNFGENIRNGTLQVEMIGDGATSRHEYCSWGDTSGAVFSEINDLQAR
ncbi:Receptor-like protein kinase FERONIA [Morus notabilis]|uniref:Receptor-like protein kinase FERONIA n=1 Tax=Morus notabilis TaxID=981085 RepID=W9R5L3_9ROSA|nr:receptor-like protein kinase FERONIA [Morus notabilis]EXB71430.1 Receptor-like protein kinase FERONIA [Morus notabilis]